MIDAIITNIFTRSVFRQTVLNLHPNPLRTGRFLITITLLAYSCACGGESKPAPSSPPRVSPPQLVPPSNMTRLDGEVSASSADNTLIKNVADGYKQTYWTPKSMYDEYITVSGLDYESSAVLIREKTEAITEWRLLNGDTDEVLASGGKLGEQVIQFPSVLTSKIRLMIDAASAVPSISQLEVYSASISAGTAPVKPIELSKTSVNDKSRKSACTHPTGVQKISGQIIVKNAFDGGCQSFIGNNWSWLGQDQVYPLFRIEEGGSISNVIIPRHDDYIHVYADTVLTNIAWLDISDVALRVKAPAKIAISNFEAYGSSERIFQMNAQASITAKNCTVRGSSQMFRENGTHCYPINVAADNCIIEDIKDAVMRSECNKSTFKLTNSTLFNVGRVCYDQDKSPQCTADSLHSFKVGGHELVNKYELAAEVRGSSSKVGSAAKNVADHDVSTYWSPAENDNAAFIQLSNIKGLVSTLTVFSEGFSGAWRLIDGDTGAQLDAGTFMGSILIADFPAIATSQVRLIFEGDTSTLKITEFEAFGPNNSDNILSEEKSDQRSECKKSTGSQIITSPIELINEFDGGCKTFYADFSLLRNAITDSKPPLFRINSGGSLKNVIFGESKGGDSIHVYADTSLNDISWVNYDHDTYEPKKHDAIKVMAPAKVTINRFDAGNTVLQLFGLNAQATLAAKNCTTHAIESFVNQNEELCNAVDVTIGNCNFGEISDSAVIRSACSNSTWQVYDSQVEHSVFCAERTANCNATNSSWTSTLGVEIPREAFLVYGTTAEPNQTNDNNAAFLTDGKHNAAWVSEPTTEFRITISNLNDRITAAAIYSSTGLSSWRLINDDTGELLADRLSEGDVDKIAVAHFPAVRASAISLHVKNSYRRETKIEEFEVYAVGDSDEAVSTQASSNSNNTPNELSGIDEDSRKSGCNKSKGLIKVVTPIVVSKAFDGECKFYARYYAKNENSHDHYSEPLFQIEEGGSLKNVMMGYTEKQAVEINADTTFTNTTWFYSRPFKVDKAVSLSLNHFEVYDIDNLAFGIKLASSFVAQNCTVKTRHPILDVSGNNCAPQKGLVENCELINIRDSNFGPGAVFEGRNTCAANTWSLTNSTLINQVLCIDQTTDCLMP